MDDEQHPLKVLTQRELEVLRLVVLGLSNRDIAEELVLAPETVRWYTKQIYSKLSVNSRVQAVNRAREQGLFQETRTAQTDTLVQLGQANNLPAAPTAFIGRQRELTELQHLLQTTRLLTLTGVGGSGKTRLALEGAAQLKGKFADGIYFVDLAPLSDANLVAKAIALVLKVMENPPEPQLDTLKRTLVGRQLLLIMDNFEHVIGAAPVVAELLAAAPLLKVLVTSREALHLSSEQEFPVPPLSLPVAETLKALSESEAGALFLQRAQRLVPQFELTVANASTIARICGRLDGLPLAIELAAALSKILSPQATLARLDHRLRTLTAGSRDTPLRQQTLRQTLDWSYNLLSEGEKQLFTWLAIFRGGRSLEAIEAVCAADLPIDLFDGLVALVDKNLLQQEEAPGGEPRFTMLETIHEYARERLAMSGEMETMRRRHAQYFVELAEQAEPELRLAQHFRWFQILELELNNFRAVFEWSVSDGDPTLGVRLAGALYLFWWTYGYHVEGQRWVQHLLERLEAVPAIYQAKFLFSAGTVAIMRHELDRAVQLFMRALERSRQFNDLRLTGWILTYLGFAMTGETSKASSAAEEGLSVFRRLDYSPGIAQSLNVIGLIGVEMGDYQRAQQAYEECLTIARETGETRQVFHVFQNIAFLARREGDYKQAWEAALQALNLAESMTNRLLVAMSMVVLAGALGLVGEPEKATRLLGVSDAAHERMGAFHQPIDQPEVDQIVADVRAQLSVSAFELAWMEGRQMSLEEAVELIRETRI